MFLGVFKVPDSEAPDSATPKYRAESWNFLMIVGAIWFRLGPLSVRILCF